MQGSSVGAPPRRRSRATDGHRRRRRNLPRSRLPADNDASFTASRRWTAQLVQPEAHSMSTSPKVAIVTGAGTGIGKAVALAFLKDGYRVVLAGRRSEPLQQTIATAAAPKGAALAVPTDVGDPRAVANLFSR